MKTMKYSFYRVLAVAAFALTTRTLSTDKQSEFFVT